MNQTLFNPVPVHIITGFLGSGKTTLLQTLLQQPELANSALLINEFGQVGIDHHLMADVAEDIILMPSGCICCAIRGELKDAIENLIRQRQAGKIAAFDQIILETTGLADPAPILSTLLHDPQLKHQVKPGQILTLVDAEHSSLQANEQPEWTEQVAAADLLLISKQDRSDNKTIQHLKQYLEQLNPAADITLTTDTQKILSQLISQEHYSAWQPRLPKTKAPSEHSTKPLLIGITQHLEHSKHPKTDVCVLRVAETVNWTAFAIWLSMLIHKHGKQILRMKGILNVHQSPTPVIIQGVQHTLHSPVHLDYWPDEDRTSRLVFIMRGIQAEQIEGSFSQFQSLFPAMNHNLKPTNGDT